MLVKGLLYAMFGYTLPRTTTGSHLIKPPFPFKQYETQEMYIIALKE